MYRFAFVYTRYRLFVVFVFLLPCALFRNREEQSRLKKKYSECERVAIWSEAVTMCSQPHLRQQQQQADTHTQWLKVCWKVLFCRLFYFCFYFLIHRRPALSSLKSVFVANTKIAIVFMGYLLNEVGYDERNIRRAQKKKRKRSWKSVARHGDILILHV